MWFREFLRTVLPALGGALGFVSGAMIAVVNVTNYYRSLTPGSDEFGILGEWAKAMLLWGMAGAVTGAIHGWLFGAAIGACLFKSRL